VPELAEFIAHGAAAWIHVCRRGRSQQQAHWSRPAHSDTEGHLTILLANMMESWGEADEGKWQNYKHAPVENCYTVY
jgi:hypothetical protein